MRMIIGKIDNLQLSLIIYLFISLCAAVRHVYPTLALWTRRWMLCSTTTPQPGRQADHATHAAGNTHHLYCCLTLSLSLLSTLPLSLSS